MAEELIDSYSEENFSNDYSVIVFHPSSTGWGSAVGQSFTCGGSYKITSAKFYLKKYGSPTGNMHAVLYAHSGTYGTSSVPTGEPLATSDDFDISLLSTSRVLETFTFTGAQQYEMSSSTKYCIIWENCESGTMDGSNHPYVGHDRSSPTHEGNLIQWLNSDWSFVNTWDCIFYVYGEAVGPPPTNIKINIADAWKDVDSMKINIADAWKDVAEVKQNIGDAWKVVY